MLVCPLQPPKALLFAFKTYFLYPTFSAPYLQTLFFPVLHWWGGEGRGRNQEAHTH